MEPRKKIELFSLQLGRDKAESIMKKNSNSPHEGRFSYIESPSKYIGNSMVATSISFDKMKPRCNLFGDKDLQIPDYAIFLKPSKNNSMLNFNFSDCLE